MKAGGGTFGKICTFLSVYYTAGFSDTYCSAGKGGAGAAAYTMFLIIENLRFAFNKFGVCAPDTAKIAAGTKNRAPYSGTVFCRIPLYSGDKAALHFFPRQAPKS
jgi:hypothetical protein